MSTLIPIRNAVLALLIFPVVTLDAIPIYSTLGPDPYTPAGPYYEFGWNYSTQSESYYGRGIAAPFSFTGATYALESVTMDIGGVTLERTPNIQIGIFYDDGGHPSLTPITTVEPNPSLVTSAQRQLITYALPNSISLTPDTSYWIVFQPHTLGLTTNAFNALYSISSSVLPPTSPVAARVFQGGEWSDWTAFQNSRQPVFRLDGTAIPEPSTWALLALGTAAFFYAARRRFRK